MVKMDPELRAARCARRWKAIWPRFQIARTPTEALSAADDVRMWLEELAKNPILDHEAERCVGEALRDLRAVRMFLRRMEPGVR
jgi:hypothetical protein